MSYSETKGININVFPSEESYENNKDQITTSEVNFIKDTNINKLLGYIEMMTGVWGNHATKELISGALDNTTPCQGDVTFTKPWTSFDYLIVYRKAETTGGHMLVAYLPVAKVQDDFAAGRATNASYVFLWNSISNWYQGFNPTTSTDTKWVRSNANAESTKAVYGVKFQ